MAKSQHPDHFPIDDDYDDYDIVGLVHANVTGKIHHVPGSPEHIAYSKHIAALSNGGMIEKNDKERDPEEVVGTVAFTLWGDAVLLKLMVDNADPYRHSEFVKWLMDVVKREGGELHWELCGTGDRTSPKCSPNV